MARRPRKRQYVDRLRSDTEPLAKKTKTRNDVQPPEFWDKLTEISLTPRAVEEHNRRLRLQHHSSLPLPVPKEQAEHLVHTLPAKSLARFARHGGPDLSDLRGHPIIHRQPSVAMGSSRSSRNRASKSIDPATTSATTKTTKSKSSAYDANFDSHLTSHGVHPVYSSQRPDLAEVYEALAVARPSLSPSQFSEGAFEAFQNANARAKNEAEVMTYVIPTILGPYQPTHPSAIKTGFNNLEPLTDGTIVQPEPDIYYGANPGELAQPVRDTLSHHLMPSTTEDRPWVPNFSVEVKGPKGTPAVATQQVRYYGAIGSRAMHSLQNYGEEGPQYEGEAHTFSSTYHGGTGTLQLYAHHTTAPTDEGGRPEYHMTKIRGFDITDTRETFVQGATAFRNARDLAKRHRDSLIQAANTRASQNMVPEEGDPPTDPSKWRYNDEELQQSITNSSRYDFGDDGETTAIPQYLSIGDAENQSQDSVALGDAPPLDFTSSFTSSFSSAKHPRQSASPPSRSRDRSSRRPRKRHVAGSLTAKQLELDDT